MSGSYSPARRLVVPGTSTLVMLAVLIGLGLWQIQRLHWKLEILDQIDRAEALPAIPLPQNPQDFTKVKIEGHLRDDLAALYGAEGRDTRDGPQMGGQLIVPLERPGQDAVLVDRGWIPAARLGQIHSPTGPITVEGYVRAADHPHMFSATDDPAKHLFYTLHPQIIGAALGLAHVAPFTLVEMGKAPDAVYPDPARALPRPPNNHLTYAITWFGLAATLVVIFVIYAARLLRGTS
jgi:surfeit locus 1 family protein